MREAEARACLDRAEEEARVLSQNLVDQGLAMSQKESVQELSSYDNHPADMATETFERELDVGLWQGQKARLGAIAEARRRLAEGAFGRCAGCGRTIPDDRLRAVPWTDRCVECAAEHQDMAGVRPRGTLEGDIIPFPFGAAPGHETDVEFDGEDAWQAVARSGSTSSTPRSADDPVRPYTGIDDGGQGIVDPADAIADPWADTPGQAFAELARRPGQPAYDPEEAEDPRHKRP